MPFMPLRPPVPGSIDQAAQRIYEMLQEEERRKRGIGRPSRLTPSTALDLIATNNITPRNARGAARVFYELAEAPPGGLLGELYKGYGVESRARPTQLVRSDPNGSGGLPAYKMVPLQARRDGLPLPEPAHSEVKPQDWYEFNSALRRSGMTTESEIAAAQTTFGHEGGMKIDPKAVCIPNDRCYPGIGGMTEYYMINAQKNNIPGAAGKKTDPMQLQSDKPQLAEWYKVYMDDALQKAGGGSTISELRDRKLANEIFDTLYQHGKYGGGPVIQDAVNTAISRIPDHERRELHLAPIVISNPRVPRVVGPATLSRIRRLVAGGYAPMLREAIVEKRRERFYPQDLREGLKYRYESYL